MRFTDYGAFVDIGGIDGLLHISEISWGKLRHPQEVLQIGDTVKVKVLSMNEEKGKISLGLIPIDTDKKRISLSIKATTAPEAEADDAEETEE